MKETKLNQNITFWGIFRIRTHISEEVMDDETNLITFENAQEMLSYILVNETTTAETGCWEFTILQSTHTKEVLKTIIKNENNPATYEEVFGVN